MEHKWEGNMNSMFSKVDLIMAMSETLDLISPIVKGHHLRIGLMSYNIGKSLKLDKKDLRLLVYSSLIHDVGALSINERINTFNFDIRSEDNHAYIGYELLNINTVFREIGEIIKNHHTNYSEASDDRLGFLSQIIHGVDRIDVLVKNENVKPNNLVEFITNICLREKTSGRFNPVIIDAIMDCREYFKLWYHMEESMINDFLHETFVDDFIDVKDILEITTIFDRIIDFRSRFTATHSVGVAYVASELAVLCGMTTEESQLMKVAGNLHDIGKLAIPKEILEKPGKLTEKEYNIAKLHVSYTYSILKKVRGFEAVHKWAGLHHEKLNGSGYPFGYGAEDLCLGSRIMGIADIFTALTEDRPYREGLSEMDSVKIMLKMVNAHEIDRDIFYTLFDNYRSINQGREYVQNMKEIEYREFSNRISKSINKCYKSII
jgi:HD-GYP domain-containing protein (c-di-GMP phosphodiesterase class II)